MLYCLTACLYSLFYTRSLMTKLMSHEFGGGQKEQIIYTNQTKNGYKE